MSAEKYAYSAQYWDFAKLKVESEIETQSQLGDSPSRIHRAARTAGLDQFSNPPILPCRALIVDVGRRAAVARAPARRTAMDRNAVSIGAGWLHQREQFIDSALRGLPDPIGIFAPGNPDLPDHGFDFVAKVGEKAQ